MNNNGVGGNLITPAKNNHIIANDLIKRQIDLCPIAQNSGFAACDDRQLVRRTLRADLLNDADYGVDHDDHHEEHVLERACDENKRG